MFGGFCSETHAMRPHTQDLESSDQEGWQSFDLTSYADQTTTMVSIVMKGTGSQAPGFALQDANILGNEVTIAKDRFYVSAQQSWRAGPTMYVPGRSLEKKLRSQRQLES